LHLAFDSFVLKQMLSNGEVFFCPPYFFTFQVKPFLNFSVYLKKSIAEFGENSQGQL